MTNRLTFGTARNPVFNTAAANFTPCCLSIIVAARAFSAGIPSAGSTVEATVGYHAGINSGFMLFFHILVGISALYYLHLNFGNAVLLVFEVAI